MAAQKYNKLVGKHVLIIGGTSGVGYAVAEASLESGASVTISSSSSARVHSSIQSLQSSYPSSKVTGYTCDLSNPTSLETEILTLFTQTGKVDHIIFTAGSPLSAITTPLSQSTYQSILHTGQVRFFAPLITAKIGHTFLNPGPESSIILTTGTAADRPVPGWSVAAGFFAGLYGMVRGLALDLRPVRVNMVSLGLVDTQLWGEMGESEREGMFGGWEGKVLTGRVGRAEDVAEAYLWLMRDCNVTGFVARSDSGSKLV